MNGLQTFKLMREASRWLVAKSDRGDRTKWTPLWMHLLDTAGIMEKLLTEWLSEAARRSLGQQFLQAGTSALDAPLELDNLVKLGRFLGAVHDLGKATPLFQLRISRNCAYGKDNLERLGLSLADPDGFMISQKDNVPHNLAGQCLLLNRECPSGVASIVGAHHGFPSLGKSEDIARSYADYPKCYGGCAGQDGLWVQLYDDYMNFACHIGGYGSPADLPLLTVPSQFAWAGLLSMADWLSSNEYYFPHIGAETGLTEQSVDSICRNRVERGYAMFSSADHPVQSWHIGFGEVSSFKDMFGFEPNAVQEAVLKIASSADNPGLLILEAPMGVGKTEAALACSGILAGRYGLGGLYFGLPTQATSNGIFSRVLSWTDSLPCPGKYTVRLAHANAAQNVEYQRIFQGCPEIGEDCQDNTNLYVHPWFIGGQKALLSDFVVGTVDNFLMASLKRRYLMMRHLGLLGKVAVIDECHAYDACMNRFLDRSLAWMGAYGLPVVILSATLPAERRVELVKAYSGLKDRELSKQLCHGWDSSENYPLLTWVEGRYRKCIVRQESINLHESERQVKVEHIHVPWQEDSAVLLADQAQLIIERMRDNGFRGCVGIIVNTVKRAQQLYEVFREICPHPEKLFLLHSAFVAAHRAELEQELIQMVGKGARPEDRDGRIIIGTQVLEQSLDIDFDWLVTDLCPMDLLLQRIGRLHRHKRNGQRPQCYAQPSCLVLDVEADYFEKGAAFVYGRYLLMRTRAFLTAEIALPSDISPLVQRVYGKADICPEPPGYKEAEIDYLNTIDRKKHFADIVCLQKPGYSAIDLDLNGLLSIASSQKGSDEVARLRVRDGDMTPEIVLLGWKDDVLVPVYPTPKYGDDVARQYAVQSMKMPVSLYRQLLREYAGSDDAGAMGAEQALLRAIDESASQFGEKKLRVLKTVRAMSLLQNCNVLVGRMASRREFEFKLNNFKLAYDSVKGLSFVKL